jgi:quinol monooxygenase YgiN
VAQRVLGNAGGEGRIRQASALTSAARDLGFFTNCLEGKMNARQLLVLGASLLASSMSGLARAEEMQAQYVQLAEIVIDAAELEDYKAAVREHIETAIRLEPGVLVLYSVSEQDSPTHIRVFEIYRDTDAYKSHLETAHFKKYKASTERMVRSLKLVRVSPIVLGAT